MGPHRSAFGAGSSPTIAAAGAIAVGPGVLAHGATMANGLVPLDGPSDFTDIGTGSDPFMKINDRYLVPAAASSVDPQWTWQFNAPSTWLATTLALNPPLHFVFTVQPRTTLPLTTMPAVQVTAVDALGNTITSYTGAVTVASSDGISMT